MKKIRRAEFLLAVAIVTSAVVLQVREYMLKAPTQEQGSVATLSCDSTQPGLAPASCATPRNQQPVDGAGRPHHATSQIWV
ncbi:hypothetical protein [Paraburkholderia sp. DHOC27]|uniref:hypothetical protein n=1 Tax=Paraburkholderia sp. DHOC27 TaxID=2303330 RepID=UPI000E3CD7B9|nr:hypothetical protein [Paraburkholderia sp. DHOC27]RFU44647.1 hypothetical protein D0B32_26470 [Paraburkholderia sp. DHOC27]